VIAIHNGGRHVAQIDSCEKEELPCVCVRDWINGVWYNHFLFIQIERTAHLINIHNGGRHVAQLWIYLFFFCPPFFSPNISISKMCLEQR